MSTPEQAYRRMTTLRAEGRCVNCKAPSQRHRCEPCRAKHTDQMRTYRTPRRTHVPVSRRATVEAQNEDFLQHAAQFDVHHADDLAPGRRADPAAHRHDGGRAPENGLPVLAGCAQPERARVTFSDEWLCDNEIARIARSYKRKRGLSSAALAIEIGCEPKNLRRVLKNTGAVTESIAAFFGFRRARAWVKA